MKLILREDQLKDIVKGGNKGANGFLIMGRRPHNPIYSLCEKIEKGIIEEGFYRTFSTDKTIEYVRNLFESQNTVLIKDGEEGRDRVNIIVLIKKGINYVDLNKAMELCGYTFDKEKEAPKLGKDIISIYYTPRYSDDANASLENQKYLYHATPSYNVKKILQYGFIPKSKSNNFEYPSRVYFFTHAFKNNDERNILDILTRVSILYKSVPTIDDWKNKKYGEESKWTIFKLDTGKIKNDTKFYFDPHWDESCIYTYDNISPKTIIDYHEYDFAKQFDMYDITVSNKMK